MTSRHPHIITTPVSPGVWQDEFQVRVHGETVPCVVWRPDDSTQSRALVALGHGGSQHKKAASIMERATRYVSRFGWSCLAIDAPHHGDRTTPAHAERQRAQTEMRVRGDSNAPALSRSEKTSFLDALAAQAVPEWQAALDATLASIVPPSVSIGYWGVSQGTWIGVPLLAAEPRFKCAVLGLADLHPEHHAFRVAAEHIRIPLRFAFQWDDPIRDRNHGLALFSAFGSRDKSMHIHPGGHTDIPEEEIASWDLFFRQHLR